MLPDIRRDDGLAVRQPVKLADDGLRFDLLRGAVEAQRLLALPAAQALPPGGALPQALLELFRTACSYFRIQGFERVARVGDER